MDTNVKFIYSILKYLTKYFKNSPPQRDEFENILNRLDHEDLANDETFYYFFVDNLRDGINWESLDVARYAYPFIGRIRMIYESKIPPDQVFTNPIDNVFYLSDNYFDTSRNSIFFKKDYIRFYFVEAVSDFLLTLINLTSEELYVYESGRRYDDCYRPNYEDEEMYYLMRSFDDDNLILLKTILQYLGEYELSHFVEHTPFHEGHQSQLYDIIIVLGKQKRLLQNIFDIYADAVQSASCISLAEAFEEHFISGVRYRNPHEIHVDYDFFIDFLTKNTDVKTFADLRDKSLIPYGDDILNAMYEYDVDLHTLNSDIYYILTDFLYELESDEEMNKNKESMDYFDSLMKKLNFKFDATTGTFLLVMGDDSSKTEFKIFAKDIDFKGRRVLLLFQDYRGEKPKNAAYRIPFEDLVTYVKTEKLYERVMSNKRLIFNLK